MDTDEARLIAIQDKYEQASAERHNAIRAAIVEKRLPYATIAKIFKVTPETIRTWARELGVPPDPRKTRRP